MVRMRRDAVGSRSCCWRDVRHGIRRRCGPVMMFRRVGVRRSRSTRTGTVRDRGGTVVGGRTEVVRFGFGDRVVELVLVMMLMLRTGRGPRVLRLVRR